MNNKKTFQYAIIASGLSLAYGIAAAQTAAPAATITTAATGLEMTYNLGVTSDYRYRGISQSGLKPAISAGFDGTLGNTSGGLYFGGWASSIKWVKDAGGNASAEIDLYAGYKGELSKTVAYDLGFLTYQFPSNKLNPSANTNEVYGALTMGPVTAKYSRSIGNLFGFAASKGSGYFELNGEFELAKGIALQTHIGKQTVAKNSAANYTDYKVGITYEALGGKFAAAVVGADNKTYLTGSGKQAGKAGVVLGFTKNF